MKKVSEFKSNYCFRIQILNVIEHRVTERMSEDSEYPLLKSNSRANASPCTGELIGGMRDNKALRESEREGPHDDRDDERRYSYRDNTRRWAVLDRSTTPRVAQPWPACDC